MACVCEALTERNAPPSTLEKLLVASVPEVDLSRICGAIPARESSGVEKGVDWMFMSFPTKGLVDWNES
jgi:hypothetical protein